MVSTTDSPPISITLPSGQLLLRQFRSSDIPELHSTCLTDAETVRYLSNSNPQKSLEESIEKYGQYVTGYGKDSWMFAVIEVESGDFIGLAGFTQWSSSKDKTEITEGNVSSDQSKPEKGYVGIILSRAKWGRGYGPQLLKAIFDFGWTTIGLQEIVLHTSENNKAMIAIAEKVGLGPGEKSTWKEHKMIGWSLKRPDKSEEAPSEQQQ